MNDQRHNENRAALTALTDAARKYADWLLRSDLDMLPDCPDEDLAELADAADAAAVTIAALLEDRDRLAADNERLRDAVMECWLKHDEPATVEGICSAALKETGHDA